MPGWVDVEAKGGDEMGACAMSELSQRDVERIAAAVAEKMHSPCSAFTADEISTLKLFIKRIDSAGKTAWVVLIGAMVSFLIGALWWGILAKIKAAQ